jgi:flagellar hook-associated protein 3 FlgL
MRISTTQLALTGLNAILDRQENLNKIQLQIATGKRVLVPSDDPAASKRILDVNELISVQNQYLDNLNMAESRLNVEEAAVDSVISLLQRARELALQGNNGVLDDQSRLNIAAEVDQLQEQLIDIANTTDSNGEYLFAGYQTTTVPFARTAANTFTYAGDDGQRFLQVSQSRQIAVGDSGNDVFRRIRNGNGTFAVAGNVANTGSGIIDPGTVTNPATWAANRDTYTITFTTATDYEVRDSGAALITSGTYTEGAAIAFQGVSTSISGTPAVGDTFTLSPSVNQDVFTTLENLKTGLRTGTASDASAAHSVNIINSAIGDLDMALENMVNVQGTVGARLNAIENQRGNNDTLILEAKKILSQEEDLDIAEAATNLNLQLTSMEAAQQVFVRLQGLSLFNFL